MNIKFLKKTLLNEYVYYQLILFFDDSCACVYVCVCMHVYMYACLYVRVSIDVVLYMRYFTFCINKDKIGPYQLLFIYKYSRFQLVLSLYISVILIFYIVNNNLQEHSVITRTLKVIIIYISINFLFSIVLFFSGQSFHNFIQLSITSIFIFN